MNNVFAEMLGWGPKIELGKRKTPANVDLQGFLSSR